MTFSKQDCPYCRRDAGFNVVVVGTEFGGYCGDVIDTPDGMKAHIPFAGACWINDLSEYGLTEKMFERPEPFEVDE